MELLVSYSWGQYYRAAPEIRRILAELGDEAAGVQKSGTPGIAIAQTSLDGRSVVRACQRLFEQTPEAFRFAIKWLPVDHWCQTELEAIKRLIDEKLVPQIGKGETWGMRVMKRRWQVYHTSEIVEYLARDIDRKVDLGHPDWWIWVDTVGSLTAVSLLRPDDIFTLGLPHP